MQINLSHPRPIANGTEIPDDATVTISGAELYRVICDYSTRLVKSVVADYHALVVEQLTATYRDGFQQGRAQAPTLELLGGLTTAIEARRVTTVTRDASGAIVGTETGPA